jgi:hypothetical protein
VLVLVRIFVGLVEIKVVLAHCGVYFLEQKLIDR